MESGRSHVRQPGNGGVHRLRRAGQCLQLPWREKKATEYPPNIKIPPPTADTPHGLTIHICALKHGRYLAKRDTRYGAD